MIHGLGVRRCVTGLFGLAILVGCAGTRVAELPKVAAPADPAADVEILRTAYGVPHIVAANLRALGFGLAYAQIEDYGERVVYELVSSNGRLGMHFGSDSIGSDFDGRRAHRLAEKTYPLLSADARALMEGFAEGVNRYVDRHPDEFKNWGPLEFTGLDVHGAFVLTTGPSNAGRFRERTDSTGAVVIPAGNGEDGSNAWALAPTRTASGKAMLLRNPHLSWDAGYYEAHLVVPGDLNWYGDVRIGRPLFYIGGFNDRLGWATTNNGPDLDEVYALEADPAREDHYLLDGRPHPLQREVVTVEYRSEQGIETATREYWMAERGPVIERADGKIFIYTAGYDGAFRMVDQYLGMMRASNLEEWRDAMRIRAHESSNFTYADADGNIFYVWNASLPARPHPPAGDTAAVLVRRADEMWRSLVPFDSLPQLRNPASGYLHNENDPFYFTNLEEPFDTAAWGSNFPRPDLRLRSQLSLELIRSLPARARLEDVIAAKHSPRMLIADRLKGDLVDAVRQTAPTDDVASALVVLEAWDNSTRPDSRGGVLFTRWLEAYLTGEGGAVQRTRSEGWNVAFRTPWRSEEPTTTPYGIADPDAAVRAFEVAVEETLASYGTVDVSWGTVHRAQRGDLDLPTSGCSGWLGCFRTVWYQDADDGRRAIGGGDGWILAVEFGDVPRAYSVLAYGQSNRPGSPHATDQLAMFVDGRLKPVAFTMEDVESQVVRRYRPGMD